MRLSTLLDGAMASNERSRHLPRWCATRHRQELDQAVVVKLP